MKKKVIVLAVLVLGLSSAVEAQTKGKGLVRDDAKYKAIPMIEKPLGFGANLPSAYSLKDYVPLEIGDQGQMGTCAGWSSTYYLASMEFAIHKGIKDRTAVNTLVYDPYRTYNGASFKENGMDEGCGNGCGIYDVAEYLVKNDVKRMKIDPAQCGAQNYFSAENSVLDFTGYVRLFDPMSNKEDQITSVCQSLVNNHPVFVGAWPPDSFFEVGSDGVYLGSGEAYNDNNGHAMTVVGYDDNLNGGSFIVVNSWGSSWGDKGFVYVTYDDFYNYFFYGVSFETQVRDAATPEVGCVTGDCQNGYGVGVLKKGTTGKFEGYFNEGKPEKGIYLVSNGSPNKKDLKMIKKLIKKSYGYTIYSGYGTAIGVFLY